MPAMSFRLGPNRAHLSHFWVTNAPSRELQQRLPSVVLSRGTREPSAPTGATPTWMVFTGG